MGNRVRKGRIERKKRREESQKVEGTEGLILFKFSVLMQSCQWGLPVGRQSWKLPEGKGIFVPLP